VPVGVVVAVIESWAAFVASELPAKVLFNMIRQVHPAQSFLGCTLEVLNILAKFTSGCWGPGLGLDCDQQADICMCSRESYCYTSKVGRKPRSVDGHPCKSWFGRPSAVHQRFAIGVSVLQAQW
jgi:hypothetical protein